MTQGPLHVGVIAPPWVPIPPPAYGGTELVIDTLCSGLQRAGHAVTLFTTGDATCPVERRWLYEKADPDHMGDVVGELRHALAAYEALDNVDIVHDHTVAGLFISAQFPDRSVVTTVHGPFNDNLADLYDRVDQRIPIVAISHHQASTAPAGLAIARVIPHGIDVGPYSYAPRARRAHVAFLGRMSPDKGVETAIEAARLADVPLVIAAKMREPLEVHYFESRIRPLLGRGIEFVGEVGFVEKVELLSTARALLNPIQWPEPFGLVMIEAMACGTPVVGFDAGDAREIVDHGITGFLTADTDGLVAGLNALDTIDRRRCRTVVEQRFSADRMVGEYVELYRRVLDGDPVIEC